MSRYATTRAFGGQRASVGRVVVVAIASHDDASKVCLRAAAVAAVSSSDMPYIADPRTGALYWTAWTFVETRTEEDVEAMAIGSWTWPVRV